MPDYEKLSPRLLLLPTVRIGNITQLFTLHYISHQHQDDKEQPLQNLDKNGKQTLFDKSAIGHVLCDKTKPNNLLLVFLVGASKQAKLSKQALRGHSVGAMPCRGCRVQIIWS